MQLDVEWLETPEHGGADATRRNRADVHALEVVRARDAIGDVPTTVDYPLMRRQIIAHQRENHHYDMLGYADAIAVGHLGDGHPPRHRCLQVNMIRANTGGDRELQLAGLGDSLGCQVGRPERL